MPSHSEVLALAIQHHQAGRLAEAERVYRHILALEPHHAEALYGLGMVAHQVGQHEAAAECMLRAIALQATNAAWHNGLGKVCLALGRTAEAVACCRRAVELAPNLAEAHSTLGVALSGAGDLDQAIASFRRALQLRPDYTNAINNLGTALKDQGQPYAAADCYRRALQLEPNLVALHRNLGSALWDQGKMEEAAAAFERVLELQPDDLDAQSSLLYARHYRAGVTPAALAQAHAEFDRRFAAPLGDAAARHTSARDGQKRLRLGFVSADLGRHPVGFFLTGVLENLARQQQETVCYSNRATADDMTERLRVAATLWRDVAGMSDERLAQQIRADGIDILFDLAGHTAHNRLLALARKPAPLQITWIGYEGTTGLAAMDYLLADRYVVPEGTEGYYREQVLRMPEGYVCYAPPLAAPPVSPLPARRPGEVTLGSFNNPAKITHEVVRVWAEILRRLPRARLVLKYRGLDEAGAQQRYRELFAGQGVEAGRLALLPASSYQQYLAAYGQIDLALDPFPFSGSATTCEALWMGVPVVTCPGETFASRHSLSHLSNVGLTETIAGDLNQYVEITVALAHDLPRLAAIRARLREQMAAAPLCDAPRFAAHLMTRLRDVWQRRCGGEG